MQVDERKFVRRDGTSLVLDGRPFLFAGFNNYYMMTRSADSGTRKEVQSPLPLSLSRERYTALVGPWALQGCVICGLKFPDFQQALRCMTSPQSP